MCVCGVCKVGSPAVHNNWSVSRAPLPSLDLSNEVNDGRASGRHCTLWPVSVLEVFHQLRGLVSCVHNIELPSTNIHALNSDWEREREKPHTGVCSQSTGLSCVG